MHAVLSHHQYGLYLMNPTPVGIQISYITFLWTTTYLQLDSHLSPDETRHPSWIPTYLISTWHNMNARQTNAWLNKQTQYSTTRSTLITHVSHMPTIIPLWNYRIPTRMYIATNLSLPAYKPHIIQNILIQSSKHTQFEPSIIHSSATILQNLSEDRSDIKIGQNSPKRS